MGQYVIGSFEYFHVLGHTGRFLISRLLSVLCVIDQELFKSSVSTYPHISTQIITNPAFVLKGILHTKMKMTP